MDKGTEEYLKEKSGREQNFKDIYEYYKKTVPANQAIGPSEKNTQPPVLNLKGSDKNETKSLYFFTCFSVSTKCCFKVKSNRI